MDQNLAHEIRAYGQLGDWLNGPWAQGETLDGTHQVVHKESGTVIATLPDWAGSVALWMCVARDAIPALLDELQHRSPGSLLEDFFQPGRTYQRGGLWTFQCDATGPHPDPLIDEVWALGRSKLLADGPWLPAEFGPDSWKDGWTDITDVQPAAPR